MMPEAGETVSGLMVKKGFTYQIMAPGDLHAGVVPVPTLRVHDRVTVKQESPQHLSLHWTAEPISDMVSDSIIAMVLNISREMPKVVPEPEEETKSEEEKEKKMVKFREDGKLVIRVDENVAFLDIQSGDVESEHEGLKGRVRTAFLRIQKCV
ncbi:hypothetical protein Dimus_029764 [Dionaea muscipula]